MKTKKVIVLISAIVGLIFGCRDEPVYQEQKKPEPKDTIAPPKVNLTDTISRVWVVTEAEFNGTPDGSSKGLVFNIKKDQSFVFVRNGRIGTWKFIENDTKVILDDGTAYKTTWTIETLTSKKLQVKVKYAITSGSGEWTLIPQ